ncbi:hypothetical protein [Sphingomonas sp. OTU376]|uniref:hypothetical protein n=1 Tax=Sphingomonas sp. OTU376 TaxID=3043863 RepID=UPI00313E9FB7
MLARIWSTDVPIDRFEAYAKFAEEISLPMFRQQTGCAGVFMYRDGVRCEVLTLWHKQSDIDALEASDTYRDTVRNILSQGFLAGEQSTRLYEAHIAWTENMLTEQACPGRS